MATPKGKKSKAKAASTPKGKTKVSTPKSKVSTPKSKAKKAALLRANKAAVLKAKKAAVLKAKNASTKECSTSKATVTDEGTSRSSRGVTKMHGIIVRKALGRKLKVEYNPYGVPVGDARPNLASYIGVVARQSVPITYDNWPAVTEDEKKKIWDDVQAAFDLPPESKKWVLSSAGTKWRSFKTALTTKYILPFKDDPEALKTRPKEYDFIEQEHWTAFVASRLTDKFLALHEAQSQRTAKQKYPHRLSRKGYIGLQEELRKKNMKESELDRSVLWKKAREDSTGHMNEEVDQVAKVIDELLEKKKAGELTVEGSNDVLSMALETPEHGGRVRAVGGNVPLSVYFNIPRQPKDVMTKTEMVAMLQKECKGLYERIAKLEEAKNKAAEPSTPMPVPGTGNVSDKASCLYEAKVEKEDVDVVDIEELNLATMKGKSCKLAVGDVSNIVAYGTVIDMESDTVHGVPLGEGNMRVGIDIADKEDALLPIPVRDELITVGQAVGSHVAWPQELVICMKEKKQMKHVPNMAKELFKKDSLEKNVPNKCKLLYRLALQKMVSSGKAITVDIEEQVFGAVRKLYILYEDIAAILRMEELSATCIVVYMRYLYDRLIESNMAEMVGFVDPARVFVGIGNSENRSKYLADRFQQGKCDRVFLVPFNSSNHWILTIISEDKDVVHIMDPLPKLTRNQEWVEVVNTAIKIFNGVTGRQGRKTPQWKNLACPKQPGGVECAYYVMRYMKEIIEDTNLAFETMWSKARNKRTGYTQAQIDEVRVEWGDYVTEHYF